jgi:serine/threonine protein kinase
LDVGQGNVLQDYIAQTSLQKLLGKGRFGQVFSACNSTGDKFAAKVIIGEDVDMREPFFMKQLDGCSSILQLQRAVINPFYTILQFPAMDYTLNDYLRICKGNVMPKNNMIAAAKQLTMALSVLQEKGIIHRDLHQSNAFHLRLFKHNRNHIAKYSE